MLKWYEQFSQQDWGRGEAVLLAWPSVLIRDPSCELGYLLPKFQLG